MCEIEEYLSQLGSELGVRAQRANEILSEVRCHLEARAQELEDAGMAREQAMGRAIRRFGPPDQVAARLTAANHRHRSWLQASPILAFGLVMGSIIGAALCEPGPSALGWFVHRATAERHMWLRPLVETVAVTAMASPAAVLVGIMLGRRRWWVAVGPPLLLGAEIFAIASAETDWGWSGTGTGIYGSVLCLFGAPVLALCFLVGHRLSASPGVRRVRTLCWGYLGILATVALLLLFGCSPELATLVALAQALAGLLIAGAVWDRERHLRRTAASAMLLCAAYIGLLVVAIGRPAALWTALVTVQGLLLALAVLRVRALPRLAAKSGSDNQAQA
jgi:hypothetical protein